MKTEELIEELRKVAEMCDSPVFGGLGFVNGDLVAAVIDRLEMQEACIKVVENQRDQMQGTAIRLRLQNDSLQKQIQVLELKMLYMDDPNTIGDRHEMGSW